MSDNTAFLHTPSIMVECPKCKEDLDMFDEKHSPETAYGDGEIAYAWTMLMEWLQNKPIEARVRCGLCGHKFIVEKMEY